jgi:hypothetical protein
MSFKLLTSLALTSTLVFGCQPADDDTGADAERLERFRSAIPSSARLEAPKTEATTQFALGEQAEYPYAAAPIAEGINGSVGQMVDLLDLIVSLPPTVFNSDTQEYVWGPFPSDDGVGYTAAYIRDTGTDADFRYHFALLRGASNDLATLTPVIAGGATPDPADEDRGVGLILWDFEADRAFREQHDPNFDPAAADNRGRFATLFGAGADESAPDNTFTFVVAVFRGFVPADQPDNSPADLDYFYGRYQTPDNVVDFLDFETAFDIDDPADGVAEDIGVRMAFLDEGTGRAEADGAGGSMGPDQNASVIECWDTGLLQTFAAFEIRDQGAVVESATDGQLADCGLFAATLDDLQIPSLQDVDPALMAALDQLASTGTF